MTIKTKRKLGPEIAIVLGSGILDGGKPGPRTELRAIAAAKLALANPKMTIIASGDGRKETQAAEPTEAGHIAKILKAHGVANRRVLIESESRDTIGNAVLVYAKFLRGQKPRKVYIVTSPFHKERAMLIFRTVLGPAWELEPVLCDVDAGDVAKAERNLEFTEQFLAGIACGDFSAVLARLFDKGKPFYRSLKWLNAVSTGT
jgi:hypothetical protein